ncbi:MAG: B12-binding domain-containing radical SAM protein [bacterium]
MKKKKVVLFFPAYASNEACPPLALIAIAGPLVTEGYEVKIIDTAMEPDFVGAVMREVEDALCLGISLVTGPMIKGAIAVGRAVKARHPDLPIILGGWHPSILPQQTLACPYVDAVIVRQGELTFLELIKRLEAGEALTGVAGTWTKERGTIIQNPPRPHTPVAMLPSRMPGYGLIDYERYYRATGLRWLMYTTSHGCPYNCSYCSNAAVYGRNLDVLPVEQVVEEVTYLVRKYQIKLLGIIDDIFFAFRPRSLEIAEGFIRNDLKFEWYIQDRADSWQRLTTAQARMFRRAGLTRIHFGAESGSDEVLKSIEKKSNTEATLAAVERCQEADIRASFGFIFGLPAEKDEDLLQTVDLIRQIYERYDRADCYTNIFTPYPGSPAWQESIDRGLVPPESFAEWADFYPRLTVLPWLNGGKHQRLQAIRQFIRFGYHQVKVGEQQHSWRHRLVLNMLRPSAQFRLKNHRFDFPLEIYGYWGLQRLKKELLHAERF